MKKILSILTILMMTVISPQRMWAVTAEKPTVGDGTADSTYQIATAGNLLWFANQVNAGNDTIFGTLTADIDFCSCQTMIGTSDNQYSGTFDGGGYTITIAYSVTSTSDTYDVTALFRYTDGATIKNLNTTGTITTTRRNAAGIAGMCYNNTSFENVSSDVAITSTYSGDATHAGLVAEIHNGGSLNSCAFTGKLSGTSSTNCAELVGWYDSGSLTLKSCYVYPSELTVSSTGSKTLVRINSNLNPTITNCYYVTALGDAQGTQISAADCKDGTLCYKLNNRNIDVDSSGSPILTWYQNIDNSSTTDTVPVLNSTHSIVYDATDYCTTLPYTNICKAHPIGTIFDDNGEITCSLCNKIADYEEPELSDGAYTIVNKGNFEWFAKKVKSGSTGINAKLTVNIDLGTEQTMIGIDYNKYAGTFDGNGHTITVAYTATENYTGLFRYLNGATIKNLHTAGTISTGYQFAGGIAARVDGSTTITGCHSNIAITSTFTTISDGSHGGLVGDNEGSLTLTNSVFDGKLYGDSTINCAGLVGWTASKANISGCYFNPSDSVTFNTSGAYTLSRGNNVSITNSAYLKAFGVEDGQGTLISTGGTATGELCNVLTGGTTDGTQAWYQTIGTDTLPVLDSTHGVVYSGTAACPQTSTYTNKTHTFGTPDSNGYKTCQNEGCGYSIYQSIIYDEASGYYLIANKKNFLEFAGKVNRSGEIFNAKLTADIDLGDDQTNLDGYEGTFDGNGHTITVNYTNAGDFAALFKDVQDATIKNLKVAGTISTAQMYAAGIAGETEGTVNITNCESSVAITSTLTTDADAGHGGLVAYNKGTLNLTNCLFSGKLLGEYAKACGGLVGITSSESNHDSNAEITNCLFNPSEVTFSSTDANTIAGGSFHASDVYYSTALGSTSGGCETAEAATGWVCYYLNNYVTDGTQVWYQTIGTDDLPVLIPIPTGSAGESLTVYGGDLACCPNADGYSNKTHDYSDGTFGDDGTGSVKCKNCSTTTSCQPATYDDTAEAYLISNKGNLIWFANQVINHNVNINGKLTADIDLGTSQTLIGKEGNVIAPLAYTGTFDGNGHTITVAYTATESYTALFRYVNGATIKNLKTAGTISTSYQFAAGIVAHSDGTTTITGCQSSVAINSTVSGDGTHGGIIANNASTIILTDCLFDGSLAGENTTNCGGLIGWTSTDATITNCLFNPSSNTLSTSGACTLTRYKSGITPTITNSYYASAFGTEQGTEVTTDQLSSGEICYNLNSCVSDSTNVWYQTLGTDYAPIPNHTHDIVYGGGLACPSTLSYGNTAHNLCDYNSDGYQICKNNGCEYVSDNIQPAVLDSLSNSYIIANRGNLIWFANKVNAGETTINGTLTADIDLGTNQTMIGTSRKWYSGSFDGQHHTITVAYNTSEEYTALFRYVSNATIQNLMTAGTITASAAYMAGVIGFCRGATLSKVLSSIAITSTLDGQAFEAGLISEIYAATTITHCAFIGKLLGEKSSCTGGLVGEIDCNSVTIADSYAYVAEQTTLSTYSNTIALNIPTVSLTITNCYYVPALTSYSEVQGTEISAEYAKSGAFCFKLNDSTDSPSADIVWYQTLGTDNSPVCDPSHGKVYHGEAACPLTKDYSNATHSFPTTGTGVLNCTGEGCTASLETATFDETTNTYLISNEAQLKWFAGKVNDGETTLNGTLTADIDLGTDQTMIGTPTCAYSGTFNGGGHTVTVNYNVNTEGAALFLNVAGADISKLGVAGSITTSGTAAGGIVCYSTGVKISECASTVDINATNANCRAGGIVEEIMPSSTSMSSSIQNCLFAGSFSGKFITTGTATCSGMVGYIYSNANHLVIENSLCIFNNQSVPDNSFTFVNGSNYDLTRCYYLTALNTAQGTKTTASVLSSGEFCYKMNYTYYDGTSRWYETLGTDTFPYPLNSHSIVYGGYDACPAGTSYSNQTHIGEKTGTDGYYHVTCTNADCSDAHTCDIPLYSSTIGGYSIANKGHLMWFSHYVNNINNTVNGILESDIDLGTASSGEGDGAGSFTPIGSSSSHQFQGTFDGGYHRIKNMTITESSEYGTGFFGHVKGNTTIENLVIDSTCTVSIPDYDYLCAGVVGLVGTASDITIKNCGNEATINAWNNVGGIIAGVSDDESEIHVQNCYNAGTISGRSTMGAICGSLINFTLTNCYNTGKLTNKSGSTESTGLLYCGRNATVTNCYNINDSQGTGVTKIDSADVYTGRLCQLLNQNNDTLSIWAQELETETAPVFSTATAGRSAGVTLTRSMDNPWGTICLPFDLTITDDDPYTLYNYIGISDSKVYLSKRSGTLSAGTPAVICMKESSMVDGKYVLAPTIGTISSTTITNHSSLCGFRLTGVYSKTDIALGYKLVDGIFQNVTALGDNDCEPFRAYLYGFHLLAPDYYPLATIADTVSITKAAELVSFAELVNDGIDYTDVPVSLANDIDMTDVSFTPIGTSSYPFHGSFNGKGHRIKNLTVSNTTGYTGLFGYVGGNSKATTTNINNLIMDSTCTITSTGTGVAGLVGSVTSTSDYDCTVFIESCGNEATITGTKNVAGLVGGVYNSDNILLKIYNSYNTGAINGDSESATLCGWANKNFDFQNCYNLGTLAGVDGSRCFYRYSSDEDAYQNKLNCYDVNGDNGTGINTLTEDQARLGYLCDKLNNQEVYERIFTQDLENDAYPIPTSCAGLDRRNTGLYYSRSMTNKWGTIVLPFDIEYNEGENNFDLYKIKSVSDTTLTLEKMDYSVYSGTPAIIRMSEYSKDAATGKYELAISTTDQPDYVIDTPDAVCGITLTGTYTGTDITSQDGYIIANNAFWNIASIRGEDKVYCSPFRAWLAGSVAGNAKLLTIGIDDGTTSAVETINAITAGTAEYFDLSGHRLGNLQPGVNIVKSRRYVQKVIIK